MPLLTVMLAVFTAFPMFGTFQAALEKYFLQTLVPPNIAKPVLGTLTMFATKASRLGSFGLIALGFTAMALMLTIDRTLNAIWRVRKPRPIAQRVLRLLGGRHAGPADPRRQPDADVVRHLGVQRHGRRRAARRRAGRVDRVRRPGDRHRALYHYVPHTPVRWRHALLGGLFVAGFMARQRSLGWYLTP